MSLVKEVQVRVFDLEIGMFVCRLDKEWTETAYPLQGFLIQNENQIQKLADECEYVYIDANRKGYAASTSSRVGGSHYVSPPAVKKSQVTIQRTEKPQKTPAPPPKKVAVEKKPLFSLKALFALLDKEHAEQKVVTHTPTHQLNDIVTHKISTTVIKPPKKQAPFHQEFHAAKQAHTQASKLLKNFMGRVKEGETVNLIMAEQAVHDCILSALRSPDALLLASYLHKKHLSIWEHSMRVTVLAISLGRFLSLNDEELTILGLCGMLHDIGALLISREMLEETDNKIELMQSHTVLGRDILLSCDGEFGGIVAEVAYSHHEYLNGSGFPCGLKNEQISPYARMISIVDLYVTLTSDHGNKQGLTHYAAMLKLLEQTDTRLDAVLVDSFCQCIGTYPIGCLVEMNTGELGIVVEENQAQKLKPKIMLVSTDHKNPRANYLLDLAAPKNEEILYEISAIVHPDKYPELNLQAVLDTLKTAND